MSLVFQSAQFQKDYKEYNKLISELPEGKQKTELSGLLTSLLLAVKRVDDMLKEMAYSKTISTTGQEFRNNILEIRKELDSKLKIKRTQSS